MIINESYGHGGDIYSHDVLLDFSATVTPLGTPPEVVEAVRRAAGELAAYPDPYCGALRDKLAALCGVEKADILCGNGAAELIFQFALTLRPKRALLPVPPRSKATSSRLKTRRNTRFIASHSHKNE